MSATDNVNAYKIEGHRHSAEIHQELPGRERLAFLPHLMPVDQGLFASCYLTLHEPLAPDELEELYRSAYADEPFVEWVPRRPARDVRDTNRCESTPPWWGIGLALVRPSTTCGRARRARRFRTST